MEMAGYTPILHKQLHGSGAKAQLLHPAASPSTCRPGRFEIHSSSHRPSHSLRKPSSPREVTSCAVARPCVSAMASGCRELHNHCPVNKSPVGCTQVADWARLQFYGEVSKGDAHITLAKACMLIALEEEAAAAADDHERKTTALKDDLDRVAAGRVYARSRSRHATSLRGFPTSGSI